MSTRFASHPTTRSCSTKRPRTTHGSRGAHDSSGIQSLRAKFGPPSASRIGANGFRRPLNSQPPRRRCGTSDMVLGAIRRRYTARMPATELPDAPLGQRRRHQVKHPLFRSNHPATRHNRHSPSQHPSCFGPRILQPCTDTRHHNQTGSTTWAVRSNPTRTCPWTPSHLAKPRGEQPRHKESKACKPSCRGCCRFCGDGVNRGV